MRKASTKTKIINELKEIFSKYPQELAAQHLAIILADYGDKFDMISDKELEHLCRKYKLEKELDMVTTAKDTSVDSIIKNSMTFEDLMKGINEEEEEDGY